MNQPTRVHPVEHPAPLVGNRNRLVSLSGPVRGSLECPQV